MAWRFPFLSLSDERRNALQLEKIRKIVRIAFEKSPFYGQYYREHGFQPDMLRSCEDIGKIPIVKRRMLKETPVEQILTVRNTAKLYKHTTSGSSGIPVPFYYSRQEDLLKNYGVLRAYLVMGMRPRDRSIALRDPIDIRAPGLFERVGIFGHDYFNVYDPIDGIYRNICARYQKIDLLKGMPSDLLNLCSDCVDVRLKIVKSIIP